MFFIGQPNIRKSFSLAFFFFPLYFPGTKHSLKVLDMPKVKKAYSSEVRTSVLVFMSKVFGLRLLVMFLILDTCLIPPPCIMRMLGRLKK